MCHHYKKERKMKKNIFYLMMLALVAMTFTSCSKDSEGKSSIIEYPKLVIQGDEFFVSPIGQAYTDQGCKATYQGKDYTANVVAVGIEDVDINTAGLYYITYIATSPDGYMWSETRTVAVCDPSITTDLSGSWTVQEGSNRNGTGYDGFGVTVKQLAPGIFSVSDFLGGWYDQRAGYGKNYAMSGQIQLLADGTLVGLSSRVPGWDDSWDSFEGKYDEATGTITWDVVYATTLAFHVILK
jgi:hypothetical protein